MDLIKENKTRWLNSDKVSPSDKEIIKNMSKQEEDESFFKDIEFGTAGMRGVLGPGTNKLNEFTITKANVGFGKYILEKFPNAKEEGVVISHDNRHKSREFTLLSAKILNDMGIKAYIFDSLRPTPELSFAVRYLHAAAGIMITASHNPKEYNGYKVYDETGCQLVPSKIARLLEIIAELPNELEVEVPLAKERGELVMLDNSVDDEYVRLVKEIQLNPDLDKSKFKIVFSPQHGTSYVNAMRVFTELGYNIIPVDKQCPPDPDFSGTLSPNPEDPRAYIEPIKLAKEIGAHLIVMTDPDGDRVGVGYLSSKGEYELFTGNQSAALLIDYVLSQRKEKGLLSDNGVMYDTIVSSSLGRDVANSYGVKVETFLTGFKFIGNRIDHYEKLGNGPKFEFGYEESYGCLLAPFARDKDGIQAILMYAEMALYHFNKKEPLDVAYEKLQEKHGFHNDICYSIMFKGSDGLAKMSELMNKLHENPLKELCGQKVVEVRDYKKQLINNFETGKETKIELPKSDVVILVLESGSTVAIRPSGTEPKCKFYIGLVSKNKKDVEDSKVFYDELLKALEIND